MMMPNPKHPPSIERIREVFDYEPTTGVITRKVKRGNNGPAGKVVGADLGQGYLHVSLDHGRYLSHRLAWAHYYGEWPTQVIDHIDGNGHNNEISNLRDVAHRENSANMLRNKSMRADAAKWRAHQADAQALAGEIERLRADAERLDWMDKNPGRIKRCIGYRGAPDSWVYTDEDGYGLDAADLRAAIDSARALAKQEEKS